jgi:16S rRNA (guanine527-N7)-methyltransferase
LQTADIIFNYFPHVDDLQRKQFEELQSLYSFWNEKINVISRKDIDNLYVNHVLHSLGIAKVLEFKKSADILDVGTGGGFPGIPLAILFPETHFHLVDSIGKKITVVKNIADALQLKNVSAEQVRAEGVNDSYDFIVSRAVTRLKEFYGWIHKKTKKVSSHPLQNGILSLKGGDLDEELAEMRKAFTIYHLKDFFQEDFFETKKVVYVPI